MPEMGAHDQFESEYMAALKAAVISYGVLIEYPKDRATLDLGLHLNRRTASRIQVTQVRVWMQVKGLRSTTYTYAAWASEAGVPVPGLQVEHVKFWYGSPEPVYLVVYIEAAKVFLAADVHVLIDALGGMPYLIGLGAQRSVTLGVPKEATLQAALDRMPAHRSMRIDGPAYRGRPLGHHFDPLRSELHPLPEAEYTALVDGLLKAHEFRPEAEVEFASGIQARIGKLYLTYEWILSMTTEFGYDEESDFRMEGEPLHAQGDVLIIVDRTGGGPKGMEADLAAVAQRADAQGARSALVFMNLPEAQLVRSFAAWCSALKPLRCAPQAMGSLTFNVLTSTNLYLEAASRLTYGMINYRYLVFVHQGAS